MDSNEFLESTKCTLNLTEEKSISINHKKKMSQRMEYISYVSVQERVQVYIDVFTYHLLLSGHDEGLPQYLDADVICC